MKKQPRTLALNRKGVAQLNGVTGGRQVPTTNQTLSPTCTGTNKTDCACTLVTCPVETVSA